MPSIMVLCDVYMLQIDEGTTHRTFVVCVVLMEATFHALISNLMTATCNYNFSTQTFSVT